ncbi:hypothetical protein JZ751_006650 [Albula glossodonta]|uniref:Uncharacterized protein n=1 Tax=Albula glossodonta TaxID=121402 RepID=A0A8T2P1Z5_9TELE|nr:hypothetical protein JZ751_006650 [Albula glossodonta]
MQGVELSRETRTGWWFKSQSSHSKNTIAVGPLSKALNPTLLPGEIGPCHRGRHESDRRQRLAARERKRGEKERDEEQRSCKPRRCHEHSGSENQAV